MTPCEKRKHVKVFFFNKGKHLFHLYNNKCFKNPFAVLHEVIVVIISWLRSKCLL